MFHNIRVDKFVGHFVVHQMQPFVLNKYEYLNTGNVVNLSHILLRDGTRMRKMILLGSTIGWSKYPQFYFRGEAKMLPRPLPSCKPKKQGTILMKSEWFMTLSLLAHKYTSDYLYEMMCVDDKYYGDYKLLKWCRDTIPSELRINNTWFTSVATISSLDKSVTYTHPHLDHNDLISCVFFFGDNVNGGDSVFFDGKSSKFIGDMVHVIKFKHGQAICGDFSKIIHGANKWNGERQVISFYTNKKIVNHFKKFGTEYYDRYKGMNYPKNYIDK